MEVGESLIACAHREVFEETNIQTEFGPFLGDIEYLTPDGKKQVSFWAAKAITHKEFSPNSEVDQLKWVEVKKVKELLTLETDKKILAQFIKLDFDTKPFILLRHAKAITAYKNHRTLFVRLKFLERSEQKFVSRTIPVKPEGTIPRCSAAEFGSWACPGVHTRDCGTKI